MQNLTLSELWEMFSFYPDALHYYNITENIENTLYYNTDGVEMDDYILGHAYRVIESACIRKRGNEIHLHVTLK